MSIDETEGGAHLRPIERTVLRTRENGVPDAEMAARLRRSPAFVPRVGALADFRLAPASRGVPR
jgi:hypothetical protein